MEVELVGIGRIGADWTEINLVIDVTGCLADIKLIKIGAEILWIGIDLVGWLKSN